MKVRATGRRVVSLTVIMLLASLTLDSMGHSKASAETRTNADTPAPIPTCTQAISNCTPPSLLNHTLLSAPASNNLYQATAAQQASLSALEGQAVDNVLTDHGLPSSDRNAVLSWGRADALAELWGLIVQAIRTDPAQRSDDQQNAVDWLTAVMHRRALAAANNAGWEYLKWAGGSSGTGGPPDPSTTVADLNSYANGTSAPVNFNNGTPNNSTSGFCLYTPPAPYQSEYTGNISTPFLQNTADSWCYPPSFACLNLLGCNDRQPSYDQFVKWGEADVAASRNQNADGAILSKQVVNALAFGGAAVGAGLTGVALGVTLGSVLTGTAFTTALFPWTAAALLDFGAATATTAPAVAGGMAAAAVGAIVTAVIVAIAIAAIVGVQVVQAAGVPGKLSSLISNAASGTPDLQAMLGDANQLSGLFGMFMEAALPSPSLQACDNTAGGIVLNANGTAPAPCMNAPPIPAEAATDPQFLVTPKDSATSTRQDNLSWTDLVQDASGNGIPGTNFNPIFYSQDTTRMAGPWFVTQSTAQDGTESPVVQSLSIHYVDWTLRENTAWLRQNADGSYSFLVAGGHQILFGSNDGMPNPNTCLNDGTCKVTDSIQMLYSSSPTDSNVTPQAFTVRVVPAQQPTITMNLPNSVVEGTPAALSATVSGGADGGYSYRWFVQQTGNFIICQIGQQEMCGYNGPFTGDSLNYTYQAPGTINGILFITDSGGRTFRKDFSVDVAAVAPTLTLGANDPGQVSFGDAATVSGVIDHAGTDDTETVTVDWGDGSTESATAGSIMICAPTCPSISFTSPSGTQYAFTGSHTYAHAGKYTVTVSVDNGAGGTDSATSHREMLVEDTNTTLSPSTTTPEALQPVTYTVTVDSPKTTPTGSVEVWSSSDPNNPLCGPLTLTASPPYTATCTRAFPTPGDYTLHATYAGDADTAASNDLPGTTLTFAHAAQAITFTSIPPAEPTVDGTYAVAATGGGSGQPVTFSIDPSTTNDACSIQGATVTFAHKGLCVVDADQVGNDVYAAATTATQSIPVQAIGSTIVVTTSPGTSVYGQAVTPTATVTEADASAPAGTVQFALDGTDVGNPVTVAGGQAAGPALASLAVGSHQVTATFTPSDPTRYGTGQDDATQVVDKAATETALRVHTATLRAAVTPVSPGAGTPTGTVSFFVDGQIVGSAQLVDGVATLNETVPTGQTHHVAAVYGGDASFTGSLASTARRDPAITASVSSRYPKTRYGWYRAPVTVTFTCTPNGAPLTTRCPAPVRLTNNGAAQSVTRTIMATNGGAATVVVSGIDIDRIPPTVRLGGVHAGGVYFGTAPRARCLAHDALSGVASCRIRKTTSMGVTSFAATATDRAGNKTTKRGSYRVLSVYLQGTTYSDGAFQVKLGHTYTITVVRTRTRPSYYFAVPYPGIPSGGGTPFHRAGLRTWTLGVTLARSMGQHPDWNLGVQIGSQLKILRVHFT